MAMNQAFRSNDRSKNKRVDWAHTKKNDKYIVYSPAYTPDHPELIGIALNLEDAKELFVSRVNRFLGQRGADYILKG